MGFHQVGKQLTYNGQDNKHKNKILNNRLTQYLEENDILAPNHYGFRKASITTADLFDLITTIRMNVDKGKIALIIFLDLKAYSMRYADVYY